MTLWFTGLSGAGKTTLARQVAADIAGRGLRAEVLDGDVIRRHLSAGLSFSREDRDTHVRRIGYVGSPENIGYPLLPQTRPQRR